MSLAATNVNQLVALDALLTERSVGQAAARMGVTQSAMSHTLRTLRELLDDPLLVRVGNRMVLTPHAEQLRGSLQRGLAELESVVSGRASFDAETTTIEFTIASVDAALGPLAAPLHEALIAEAPGASLRFVPLDERTLAAQLERGDVDVGLIPSFFDIAPLCRGTTRSADLRVIMRSDHPLARRKLTLERYAAAPHAMLSLRGEGPSFIDDLLDQRGLRRQVVVRVPWVLALTEIVLHSDCVATLPAIVTNYLAERWSLRSTAFPMRGLSSDLLPCWHPRFDRHPPNRFLRQLVDAVLDAAAHGSAGRL